MNPDHITGASIAYKYIPHAIRNISKSNVGKILDWRMEFILF